jgi:alkanesulfonate monooxygenase SsuD/methylene tetrahydromethanopterin reductase-like flavin-dependent oxidoreductase (luciferase family)
MSFLSGIDFSKFDLDAPVGEIKTNGMQTMLKSFGDPTQTLRQIMLKPSEFTQMVGTADTLAGIMQDAMEEVGGDGYLIAGQFKPKYITSIVDELVPALQKRQLTRTEYGHDKFRDNLMAF